MRLLLWAGVGALLGACNADVFTSGDGGSDGGSTGADAASDAASDVVTAGDGPTTPPTVACANSANCASGQQECCAGLVWSQATCQPTSTGTCMRSLSCDDVTDCPSGHACCANTVLDLDAGTNPIIVSTQCLSSCTANQLQLCRTSSECAVGTCNDWNGTPGWVMTCQP